MVSWALIHPSNNKMHQDTGSVVDVCRAHRETSRCHRNISTFSHGFCTSPRITAVVSKYNARKFQWEYSDREEWNTQSRPNCGEAAINPHWVYTSVHTLWIRTPKWLFLQTNIQLFYVDNQLTINFWSFTGKELVFSGKMGYYTCFL